MSESFHDLNQTGAEFLLVDLDVAMTFMDVAEASRIEETKHRNRKNARQAYDAVLHLLEKLKPDAGQRQVIDAKLARLKTRLEASGVVDRQKASIFEHRSGGSWRLDGT